MIRVRLWWLFTGFCFGLTPYIFHLAERERGYPGIGGELIFPLIPFIFLGITIVIKEVIKSIKELLRDHDQV